MAVARNDAVAMVNFHSGAVPTLYASKLHNAVRGGVVIVRRRTIRMTVTVNVDTGVIPTTPTHDVREVRRPYHPCTAGCFCR